MARNGVLMLCLCLLGAAWTRPAAAAPPSLEGPRTVSVDGDMTVPLGGWLAADEYVPHFDDVILVNGVQTSAEEAVREAASTGDQLGTGVSLVYNATTCPIWDLLIAVWEKLTCADWSLNGATGVVLDEVRQRIDAGQPVYLVGYSEGTLCICNALRAYEDELDDRDDLNDEQRRMRMESIHVLTVGGACFDHEHPLSAGWPQRIGSVFHVYHENDLVANVLGPGEPTNWPTSVFESHAYIDTYVPVMESWMLLTSGTKVID